MIIVGKAPRHTYADFRRQMHRVRRAERALQELLRQLG
jgi:hypothetical protein